ncbi:MAG TPA: hypothetical protein VII53_04865 [Solirubrobacteraceae bacterium]
MRTSLPSRAYGFPLALLPILAGALFALALPTALLAAEPCPNEQLRAESLVNPATGEPYSAQLPGCRAYELVSPPETGGVPVPVLHTLENTSFGQGMKRFLVSEDGSVFFISGAAPAGTGAIEQGEYLGVFRSRRTGFGWDTRDMTAFGVVPGDSVLKEASANGSRILIETPLTLSSADLDNPAEYIDRGMDLYVVSENAPPQLVTRGELPNATPGQNAFQREAPFANAELSAVGFTSLVSLQSLEGGASSSAGCYIWANVESRLAYLTNPEGPRSPNCTFLAVAPDGRAIIEDTSGDFRTGLIFASAGAGEFTANYTVQLSGGTEHAASFDALSPGGQIAYITSTDKLDPGYENAGKPSVYAVSMTTGAFAQGLPAATCISCLGGSDDERVRYVGQSADGSHVYFSTGQGLWSWDEQTGKAIKLTEATDVSQVVSSQNGQFVIGVTSQLAGNLHGTADVYEFFTGGHAPLLITSGTSADEYVLVGRRGGGRGGEDLPVGGVSDDGQRVVYEQLDPVSGAPSTIEEWATGQTGVPGQTTQISPAGATYADKLLGTSGGELENVFFEAHQPMVGQDLNAGTGDIYDARIDGGFPAPAVPANDNQTPNPTGPTAPTYTTSLTPPGISLAPLPPDTSHPASASKAKALTRAQKLAKALEACKKQPRKKRAACKAQARKKYGTRTKTPTKGAK